MSRGWPKGRIPGPNKGRIFSEEWKKNIRSGHQNSEKFRLSLKSDERRSKISKTLIGCTPWNKGRKCPEISKALLGKPITEAQCLANTSRRGRPNPKLSATSKSNWKNPDYVRRQMLARKVSPNRAEVFLSHFLDQLFPNEYRYVGNGQVIISGKCPDFINVNGQKKIIELFGNFFHKSEEEITRKEVFEELGYKTLIVWGQELKDLSQLELKLRMFHREA